MKTLVLVLSLAALIPATETPAASNSARPVNLALHRPYHLDPTPNYQHCTDPGDRTQLTDGEYVQGYFWVQQGTVGWSGRAWVRITVDLGQVQPIGGLAFRTAAGTAGVEWPAAIYVLTSDDARVWHVVGDLVEASNTHQGPPPATGYAVHRYVATNLFTRGRYVQWLVVATGPYVFVDEIEIFRGPDALLTQAPPGPVVTNVSAFYATTRIRTGVRRRLTRDLAALRGLVNQAELPARYSAPLKTELDAIERAIPQATASFDPPSDWTTVFPLHPLHRRLFEAQARLWRAAQLPAWWTWPARRWDMFPPIQMPRPAPASIEVHVMPGEYRSAAFNLASSVAGELTLKLRVQDLPGAPAPDWLRVHAVQFTDTQSGVPVAAALPELPAQRDGWHVPLIGGLPAQVWLTVHVTSLPAADYQGALQITDEQGLTQNVPLRLKVYPFAFPSEPSLHLGGWDYTDRERCYDVTPENRAALIRHLREHFVDSPWAQSSVLTRGRYDATGRMIEAPDPSAFRTWLDRWPKAQCYLVFANVSERFEGFPIGTEPFRRAVSEWIHWWVRQLRQWTIRPEQLGLLLVDEPHTHEQDRIIIAYARVIQAAEPEVVIWEDPTWRNPAEATPELFEVCDVLCPNLPMWIGQGRAFADFYLAQQRQGRTLWFYSCSGPGRLLDPYSYHRLQQWFCWKYGAAGSGFWAFGDSNGASSWNEYLTGRGAYTPLFLAPDRVAAGKHMEAIREGIEDFETLRMLRERVAALEKKGLDDPGLRQARAFLEQGPERVLAFMREPGLIYWQKSKDRTVADAVRLEALRMLERLQPLQ